VDENALAAFAEGMGAEGDRQRIEDHLAKCEECVGVVAQAARGLSSHTEASVLRTSEDSVLARGTRVGRYVVDVLVGRGAMGAVYAAKDPDLKRKVAVKLLRAEGLSGPARLQMRARLLREAQAMARLSHPEVITVYDVGSFGDHLFIAMEFVDGGTLRQWRSAQHRSCAEILAVYERAGSGLAAAHEAGLIHRDFKPDNVLVGGDGRVRVLDFGLARSIARGDSVEETLPVEATDERGTSVLLTRAGTLLGTPAYMAPEQLRGNAADARSDIFGFCVSLYEALYGNRPFAGSTVRELLTAVESGVVRATPKAPRVPAWVRTLLLRGLRAAPETRLSSMRELLVALRANDAGSSSWPAGTREVRATTCATKPRRGRPWRRSPRAHWSVWHRPPQAQRSLWRRLPLPP
jgi:serine/threonine protein kinase